MKKDNYKKQKEDVKDNFDELFPLGKTNRSSALLIFLKWEKMFNEAIRDEK